MSAPDFPDEYTIHSDVSGSLDTGLDDVRVKELPVIRLESAIKEIPRITTESVVDIGLDNIQIKHLPKVEVEIGMKPTRIHFPAHYRMCASLFGIEVFSVSVCGEAMTISEPYTPHRTEICR